MYCGSTANIIKTSHNLCTKKTYEIGFVLLVLMSCPLLFAFGIQQSDGMEKGNRLFHLGVIIYIFHKILFYIEIRASFKSNIEV